ncbi:MAG: hypothetical protein KGL70_01105, partial [Betaproteobacteria bacterium]|nr:hypothetical protein [Betaproteobacteria bacterium]
MSNASGRQCAASAAVTLPRWHDPCIAGVGIGTTYAPEVSSFFKDRQFCERFESNAVAIRCQATPPVPRLFC